MLLPQTKEREYRFKLALRIGLPIFGLILALISHTFITTYSSLQLTFYIESTILLLVSIYFIFYLIYHGFSVNITDRVTNTFSREYLYQYLNKEIKKEKKYTLMLLSVDNLYDINNLYGMQNGDKVLFEVVRWVSDFLEAKGIHKFPIGHMKSGDFLIGFKGIDTKYKTIMELMHLKMDDFKVDDMEVKVSLTITDTSYSHELEYLIENLFDLQKEKNKKQINPNELESLVVNAIKDKSFILNTQPVFDTTDKSVIRECFIKLKTKDAKLLYPKSYMKIVKKLGLSVEYDLMILEEILKKSNDFCGDEVLAISISPASLRGASFLSCIREIFNHQKIMFILSEVEYYPNITRYNYILNSLRDMGILIAIDRLGALNTSFLYLRDLDIDAIRFDSFYTKDATKYKSIVLGYNAMAHLKGVKTWVKMIEDEKTKNLIKNIGIDYIQGKYLAPLE